MALFPRAAQSIRAHSIFFQASQVRDKDIGVTSGLAVTRSSATAVAIASGNVKYNNAISAYAGGSIGTIPAASSGKHRYDAIVYDCPTSAVKRLAGSEDTPSPYSGGFLNNKYPAPPQLESETQILLAIIKVTQAGVVDENHGNYCVSGVADLRLALSDKLGVSGGDSHNSLHDSSYAALVHASRHQSGGADAIKLDDLAAPDANTDLDASTTKHGLMPAFPNTITWLRGDKTWQKNSWGVDFEFGDGSAVISAQSKHTRAGQKACKIVKAYVRSTDGASAPSLLSGSATVKLYIHDINAEEGTAVETITLSSVSNYTSGDLSRAVAAGKWVTVEVSGITNFKCLVVSLEFEAT